MSTKVLNSIVVTNGLVQSGVSTDSTAGGQTLYNDAGTLKFVDLVDTARLQWSYASGTNNLSADLFNYSITDTQLRYGTGTSVIGRSASGSGPVADIAASADGQVLTRVAGALTWAAPAAGGGTTILDGAGPPTAATGAAGNYYEDTTSDQLYGPKGTAVAEQRITVTLTPDSDFSNDEYGVQVRFGRGGVITRLRYQRRSASAGTLNLRVWNDDAGGAKIADVADTQSTTGAFEVTLSPPLVVTTNALRTFSMGSSGQVPYKASVTNNPVTSTADCTFVAYRKNLVPNTYPDTTITNAAYYVEPVFEPDSAWPLAVREIPYFTSSTPGQVGASGGGTVNFLRADGTWAPVVGAVTDTSTIDLTLSAGSLSGIVVANSIGNTQLRTGVAASVIGRSTTSTGNVADIQATADGVVLQRLSGSLLFAKYLAENLDGTQVRAYLAANYSQGGAGTIAVIKFDTESQDSGSEFDPSSTNWSFTPAATGWYLWDVRVTVAGLAASTRVFIGIFQKTGFPANEVKRLTDGEMGMGGNLCLVSLTAGTAYQIGVYFASGTATIAGDAAGFYTSVAIRRIY